jgi:hypothetical protein
MLVILLLQAIAAATDKQLDGMSPAATHHRHDELVMQPSQSMFRRHPSTVVVVGEGTGVSNGVGNGVGSGVGAGEGAS